MLFNSLQYAVFLPIVFALYWIVPHKQRWIIILASSYYFYMSWNVKYLLLIMFITGVSFAGALLIEGENNKKKKKIRLGIVVCITIALLFIFKFIGFIGQAIVAILNMASIPTSEPILTILLPVGISFYTFQAIGYIVDVYRGNAKAEHHIGQYAAFISFFPQLVSGPIVRTESLMPQIKNERYFDYEQATYGLKLMAWGFFKKIVIADTLAVYVDMVYADIHYWAGFARLLTIFFFSIQIYCDFSGYSDIARGTAKLFGIDLMENFKSPYFSASIKEFWRRWHISLSSWFRDYVYIPLGGNRVSKFRNSMNLLITFLLSGLWHGASLTFVTWGGLHGGAQIAEKMADGGKEKEKKHKIPYAIRVCFTFLVVSALWTFFRAKRIKDAGYMLIYWYYNINHPIQWIVSGCDNLGIDVWIALKLLLMILLLAIYDYFSLKRDVIHVISKWKLPLRWAVYIGLVVLLFFWAPSTSAEFIYFDF